MKAARGFTLVETLVALAVFAVVAALAWGGLDQLARSRAHIDREQAALRDLQRSLVRLDADLRRAVDRPLQTASGARRPAFEGRADGFTVSHQPEAVAASVLPGVRASLWQWREGVWQRLPAQAARGGAAARGTHRLEGVERVQLRYLDAGGRWHAQWPEAGTAALPRAVELRLTLAGRGEVRRLVELLPEARE